MGLDAAGKTTILYKLKLGEIVTTIPTIGASPPAAVAPCCMQIRPGRRYAQYRVGCAPVVDSRTSQAHVWRTLLAFPASDRARERPYVRSRRH